MKKIVQINSVCNGSTGKIMLSIDKILLENDFDSYVFYGRRKSDKTTNKFKFSNIFSFFTHVLLTYLFNNHGRYSYFVTKKSIKKLRKIKPDIIHLHNIHGYYVNYELLFDYLCREFDGKLFWTLHDCWSFTGHCSHYTAVDCDKWKSKCFECPQVKEYPFSLFIDSSQKEYKLKKKVFTSVSNLTIITPSIWLKSQVEQSFLSEFPVKVINNGIDLNIFKNIDDKNIYKMYNIPTDKKILLGVASVWTERKGFNDFIKLSKSISRDIVIIMVGLNKKQLSNLPENIIGIQRTENVRDLAALYSVADIFLNPTYEDTYPTVVLESIACGTPVISYDVGGCSEQINNRVGKICRGYVSLFETINSMLNSNFKLEIFDNSDYLKNIDSTTKFNEYLEFYGGDK